MRDFIDVVVGVPNMTSFTFNTMREVPIILITRIYAVFFCIHDR